MLTEWVEGTRADRVCYLELRELNNIERETYMATSTDGRMLTCKLANPQPGCETRKTSQYIPNVYSTAST
jgi:hypothetical protein